MCAAFHQILTECHGYRFEKLEKMAAHCGHDPENNNLKKQCLRGMAEELGLDLVGDGAFNANTIPQGM